MKFKVLHLLLLTFTLIVFKNSYADFTFIKVSNFKAEYQTPAGVATADEFIMPVPSQEQVEMRFFKRGNSYVFIYQDKEYILKNPPAILNEVESFSISQFSLWSEKSTFKTELEKADIFAKNSETHLQKFSLSCPEKTSSLGNQDRVIDSCTTNSKIKLDFAHFKDLESKESESNSLQNFLAQVFFDLKPNNSPSATDVKITNLNASVSQNAFQLTMGISMDFSVNVKGSGIIWYLPKEKQIKIRLDVLKASILNVKERVFSAIEEQANPLVVVQRPYIIINQK